MEIDYQYQLKVDGVRCYYSTQGSFELLVNSTGLEVGGYGNPIGSYTYSGSGTFLGLATTQGATTPDYAIGDFIDVNTALNLYSVAQQAALTGKTQIGNRAITKKMFGTREITKEVVNGVVVYEKATPSGYSVTIYPSMWASDDYCNVYINGDDNTSHSINDITTFSNVTSIKFNTNCYMVDVSSGNTPISNNTWYNIAQDSDITANGHD